MTIYEVMLGVDRAARDTGRRLTVRVLGRDKLSAAITAESMADHTLDEPEVEYTHAISVRPMSVPSAALAMAA